MHTDAPPALSPPAADSARFWDRMARRYAAATMADPAGYERTLQRVAGLLQPGDRVLEVGCGTGTTALRLAAGVQGWLGTDDSARMIDIARAKLAAQPVPGLRFVQGEATADAAMAPADVVLAFNMLHLVPEIGPCLQALRRQLRPGCLFVSKTPCIGEMNPLLPRVALPLLRVLGLAPAVHCLRGDALVAAAGRQRLRGRAVERHGSRRRDPRVVIVARRPA